MEILKEEVLGKVIGGKRYFFEDYVDDFADGLKEGLYKDIGPLSVVRGAAKIGSSIKNQEEDWSLDFSKGVGEFIGGAAQTCALVKLFQSIYKKLIQNEHVKKFFS